MNTKLAIECLKTQRQFVDDMTKEALSMAIKALEATSPCDLCVNNPPSSMDGKPCSCCPAEPYMEEEG